MTSTTVGRRALRARLAMLAASTGLCSGLAAPAAAQLAAPAPVRQSIDANGVDLFRGTLNLNAPAVSMGQGAPQGLSYYQLTRGFGWTDNLTAALNINGSVATVTFGGTSDSFTISGSTYTSTEAKGATLSLSGTVYTYTTADGTVAHFDSTKVGVYPYYANTGRVTDIASPSGAKLTFFYHSVNYCSRSKPGGSGDICTAHSDAYRIDSVSNSYGYKVAFAYASEDMDLVLDPDTVPTSSQFTSWGTVISATMINLAAASSSTPTETFGTTTSGGSTYFSVSDAMNRTTKYRIDGYNVLGITRPGSTSEDVTITNSSGRVTSITTAAGTATYGAPSDVRGVRTVTVTDSLSHVTTYKFDIASQRMTSMTDALGNTTSREYDASGRITRVVTPDGHTTPESGYVQYSYDSRGNVTETRVVSKTPGTPADIVTSATYDSTCANPVTCNQPITTTDANSNVTNYSYDPTHGGVTVVTAPAPTTGAVHPETRYSYTALQAYFSNGSSIVASGAPVYRLTGTSTCQTTSTCAASHTADEVVTSTNYGPQTTGVGNNLLPVSVSRGAGDGSLTATATLAYDDVGNHISVDGPLSGTADTTTYRYDADRELVGVISPDPDGGGSLVRRAERLTYSPHGVVTETEIGNVNSTSDTDWASFSSAQQLTTTLDAADRKVKDVLTAGGTTYQVAQYGYDAAGRPECTALRMTSSTWGSLPSSACTLATTGSAEPDRITKNAAFDADNRVTLVKTAFGTTAEANEITKTYNTTGTVATATDAQGNKTSYEYDGFDRLVKTRYPDPAAGAGTSSAADYEQLVYTGPMITSRRLRGYAGDSSRHIDFTYDHLNRVTIKDLPGSEPDVNYTYDNLGRLTSTIFPGSSSQTLTFTYDALSRKLTETGPLGTMSSLYDLAGRKTMTGWPDGLYVTYEYLVTGEMTAIRENAATSGIGVLATYSYDNLGRRIGITRGNGTTSSYGFDNASELTSLSHNLDFAGTAHDLTHGFSYNPAGQIAGTTRSNDSYAWPDSADVNRAYAVNGLNQMTTVGGFTYSYDARGNLTDTVLSSFTYTAENHLITGPSSASLGYDQFGRLSKESQTSGGAIHFLYDGQEMTGEYISTALQRRYVYGPGTDEPVVWYEGSGTTDRRWLHADERGSVIAVSDASGASIGTNTYDEYGVPNSGNIGRFQYTGQAYLPSIGMYYYKARIYSSRLGRFMQTDPIGYGDGMNWHNYAGGDPINARDSNGYDRKCLNEEAQTGCWDVGESNPQGDYCPSNAANPCDYDPAKDPDIIITNTPLSSFTGGFDGGSGGGGGSPGPSVDGADSSSQNESIIPACLSNIDSDTLFGLGLDGLGLVASATGLKGAWEIGSVAVGATAAVLSVTLTGLGGDNKDQGIALGGSAAAIGLPLIPESRGAAAKLIGESIPVLGIGVSAVVLAVDTRNALKKAGCF
jgi:RHS repeat-associated protein